MQFACNIVVELVKKEIDISKVSSVIKWQRQHESFICKCHGKRHQFINNANCMPSIYERGVYINHLKCFNFFFFGAWIEKTISILSEFSTRHLYSYVRKVLLVLGKTNEFLAICSRPEECGLPREMFHSSLKISILSRKHEILVSGPYNNNLNM